MVLHPDGVGMKLASAVLSDLSRARLDLHGTRYTVRVLQYDGVHLLRLLDLHGGSFCRRTHLVLHLRKHAAQGTEGFLLFRRDRIVGVYIRKFFDFLTFFSRELIT